MHRKQQGCYQRDIAEALGGAEDTVSRWLTRAPEGGAEALRTPPRSGQPPKLSETQKRMIPAFLWHGAEAYGFHGAVGTCARITWVIEEEFGVRYHKGPVSRLLRERHGTPQVLIRRARQRHEEAIRRWRVEVGPERQRRARRERRVPVFVDESEFYLLPGVVRTYAPEGQTPILHEWQTRDHLSVMGGMTPAGTVYTLARQESLNGLHTVALLLHLQGVAGERLLVTWAGSPIHRREEVKEFVAGRRGTIWVEALPGNAPDLNRWDEGGGHHLKYVELRKVVGLDLEELHQEFHLAIGRLRQKPHLIRSFFAQAGLGIEKV